MTACLIELQTAVLVDDLARDESRQRVDQAVTPKGASSAARLK